MNIQPYRRFQTRRGCREWCDLTSDLMSVNHDSTVTEVLVLSAPLCGYRYRSNGYAWRNPQDAEDATLSIEIAQGRACAALADIIWQADTAQAIHKAQAMDRLETRVATAMQTFSAEAERVISEWADRMAKVLSPRSEGKP